MPKHIFQLHITHLCNLKCTHCYQEEYNNHMELNDIIHCLDEYESFLKNKNLKPQINLTGGEPLLHPDFFKVAKEIKNRNIQLGILTNGTLITPDVAKKLKDLKPIFVQVSLDGVESTHDKIRGKGNFQKALSGIDNLKNENVKVLVSFTAQQSNYKDYKKLAKICNEHKVDKLWWDRIVTYNEEDTKTKALTTKQFQKLVKNNLKRQKQYKFLKKTTYLSNERSLQFCNWQDCSYQCSAGKNLLVVTADGSIMPCRRLPFVIGNIKEQTFEDAIKNSNLMKKLSTIEYSSDCKNCKLNVVCKSGSKCITYAQTNDLFKKDPNCLKNN